MGVDEFMVMLFAAFGAQPNLCICVPFVSFTVMGMQGCFG
jgi:hypothetical protein